MPDYNRKPKSRAAALLALPTLLIGLLTACDPGPTGQSTDQSPGISTNTPPTPIAAPPVDTREKLAAAKEILSGFAVVVLAESYAEGFQSFCCRLRWPDCKVVNKRGHWRPPKPVLDAATRTSAPGRRLGRRPPGAPHHGVVKALDHFNLTPADLAAIADASQLSTELYFAARE